MTRKHAVVEDGLRTVPPRIVHLLDARLGPLAGAGRLRRVAPFAITALCRGFLILSPRVARMSGRALWLGGVSRLRPRTVVSVTSAQCRGNHVNSPCLVDHAFMNFIFEV